MSARERVKLLANLFHVQALEAQRTALVLERGSTTWALMAEAGSEEGCAALLERYDARAASGGGIEALVNVRGGGKS